jgi:AcrR family transcriptional regulator
MGNTLSTRERILQEGLNLISTAGFAGVTLGVLAERTRLSKSGLFAHFGSKEEVQLGILDQLAITSAQTIVTPALLAPEGLSRLKAVVHNWLGWSAKAGLAGGCPVAAGLFELDDAEGAVRNHLLVKENEWREFLVTLTRSAIMYKELRPTLDVDQFVWELQGIYLSHHASSRFVRDPNADKRAHAAFDRLLQDALPA